MPKVQETIELKCTPEEAFNVVWDYARYPEFVPNVDSITLKNKKKKSMDVVFGVKLFKEIFYTVHVTQNPFQSIEWRLVEGSLFKKIDGRWNFELKPKTKKITLATYTLDVEFGLFVPASITKALVASSLPAMLSAFKKQIESAT